MAKSNDYYRRTNAAAYEQLMRQMQQLPGQAVFATATCGTFVATPRPPVADVVEVETPKAKPVRVNRAAYWGWLLGLSVLSIFPAWGPHIWRACLWNHHAPADAVSVKVTPVNNADAPWWRYYAIKKTDGSTIHVRGEHFAYRSDGTLAIATPYETVFSLDASLVSRLSEESARDWQHSVDH